jgi:hypothetical protein
MGVTPAALLDPPVNQEQHNRARKDQLTCGSGPS